MATVVLGLAVLIYGNLIDLKAELPRLIERAQGLIERLRTWGRGHLPVWVLDPVPDAAQAEAETAARLKALMSGLVNTAASFLAEALIVVFYLVFLLLEARRFPERVRAGFPPEQAERVIGTIASINGAISSYLRAKTLASFVTALPVVVSVALRSVLPGHVGGPGIHRQFHPVYREPGRLGAPGPPGTSRTRTALATALGPGTVGAVAVRDQQLHRTKADCSCRGPEPVSGPDRARVLGSMLGSCRDGPGRSLDGGAQNRVGKHPPHTSPGSADGRGVKETRLGNNLEALTLLDLEAGIPEFRSIKFGPLKDFPFELVIRLGTLHVRVAAHVLCDSKIPSTLAVWILARS